MHAKQILSAIILVLCCTQSFAQTAAVGNNTPATEEQMVQSLIGTWVIDLRPSPNAEAYLKDFTIKSFEAKTLKGIFYDTPFANGRIHTAWGKLYFAFTTADGSGTYFHSVSLENGKLSGISFSENRQFVMPWTGTRKE